MSDETLIDIEKKPEQSEETLESNTSGEVVSEAQNQEVKLDEQEPSDTSIPAQPIQEEGDGRKIESDVAESSLEHPNEDLSEKDELKEYDQSIPLAIKLGVPPLSIAKMTGEAIGAALREKIREDAELYSNESKNTKVLGIGDTFPFDLFNGNTQDKLFSLTKNIADAASSTAKMFKEELIKTYKNHDKEITSVLAYQELSSLPFLEVGAFDRETITKKEYVISESNKALKNKSLLEFFKTDYENIISTDRKAQGGNVIPTEYLKKIKEGSVREEKLIEVWDLIQRNVENQRFFSNLLDKESNWTALHKGLEEGLENVRREETASMFWKEAERYHKFKDLEQAAINHAIKIEDPNFLKRHYSELKVGEGYVRELADKYEKVRKESSIAEMRAYLLRNEINKGLQRSYNLPAGIISNASDNLLPMAASVAAGLATGGTAAPLVFGSLTSGAVASESEKNRQKFEVLESLGANLKSGESIANVALDSNNYKTVINGTDKTKSNIQGTKAAVANLAGGVAGIFTKTVLPKYKNLGDFASSNVVEAAVNKGADGVIQLSQNKQSSAPKKYKFLGVKIESVPYIGDSKDITAAILEADAKKVKKFLYKEPLIKNIYAHYFSSNWRKENLQEYEKEMTVYLINNSLDTGYIDIHRLTDNNVRDKLIALDPAIADQIEIAKRSGKGYIQFSTGKALMGEWSEDELALLLLNTRFKKDGFSYLESLGFLEFIAQVYQNSINSN